MAGYSSTPLARKLGYQPGLAVHVHGEPANYRELLALPADFPIRWLKEPREGVAFVHLFSTHLAELESLLGFCRRRIAPAGVVWVSWPKKASKVPTDITEDRIRGLALPLGFVDIKVCAVDEVWSGLKLMIRKELR